MQLTNAQRSNLELYVAYRFNPPTFWSLFSKNLIRYLVIAGLIVLLALLGLIAGTETFTLFAMGLFIGILFRDIGLFLRFLRVWPATAAVLDWPRLEALLADADSI